LPFLLGFRRPTVLPALLEQVLPLALPLFLEGFPRELEPILEALKALVGREKAGLYVLVLLVRHLFPHQGFGSVPVLFGVEVH
jgi:hypothetical protein